MKSFEAFQLYPDEVKRLQFLDEEIRGGSTAAMAAMCGNVLYVSNVGDSRVLLYNKDGSCLQLTCDHNTDNEQELQRLSGLGLDAEKLKKNRRVGTHENTRSFGDYNLKEGFLDVDSLKWVPRHVLICILILNIVLCGHFQRPCQCNIFDVALFVMQYPKSAYV